jgi:myotubularin-related protein 6/7/8
MDTSQRYPFVELYQADDVTLFRKGQRFKGTLHLTAHHLIYRYSPEPPSANEPSPKPEKLKELWITYPMISFCTYRPSPGGVFHPPSIRIRCRDFVFVAFHFKTDQQARAVYDTIKNLTCKVGKIDKLYAFNFKPAPQEKDINGWSIYDARKEFARQGISPEKGWRITNINSDYQVWPHARLLPIPRPDRSSTPRLIHQCSSYLPPYRITS